MIPVSDEGLFDVYTRGSANLVLDTAGYYADATYGAAAAKRAFDSRAANTSVLGSAAVTKVKVADEAGDQVAVNLTSTAATSAGFATGYLRRIAALGSEQRELPLRANNLQPRSSQRRWTVTSTYIR